MPWLKSTELFEALSEYTGVTELDERAGKGYEVHLFLKDLMKGIKQDPNNDGKIDHDDVLFLWKSSDGILGSIKLQVDSVLESYGHKKVPPVLMQLLAKYTSTNYNPIETLKKEKELESYFNDIKTDITGDGKVDFKDVIAVWNGKLPDYSLGKIQELSKKLLEVEDPLSHTKEIAELGMALSEYLNTGYFDKKGSLFEFFGNKKDLNGDGKIDY